MRKECKFCENCGKPYSELIWPRVCNACGHISYLNPVAASIAMVPVEDTLLYIQRAIEPRIGYWAMPGGFMDVGESAEDTAARELYEETGLIIPAEQFNVFGRTRTTVSGQNIIIFCLADIKPLSHAELKSKMNIDLTEVLDISPYRVDMETAFPLHTSVRLEWLNTLNFSNA